MIAMAGGLGMKVDIGHVPSEKDYRGDILLFSESAGRIIASVAPENKDDFEILFSGLPCRCIGMITENKDFIVDGPGRKNLISVTLHDSRNAWKKPFGELI
jgi:phosphoribosylformylglycinamidine synthase